MGACPDSLSEEFNPLGSPGFSGRFGVASAWGVALFRYGFGGGTRRERGEVAVGKQGVLLQTAIGACAPSTTPSGTISRGSADHLAGTNPQLAADKMLARGNMPRSGRIKAYR